MQISDWISLGSSFGALVAAVIALISLFEIVKQRKSSFKPDLTILNNNFRISYKDINNSFPTSWDQQEEESSHSLSIVNIGLGVAKSINAKWSYDHDKLLKAVTSSSPDDRNIHNQIIQEGDELFVIYQDGKIKLPVSFGLEKKIDYVIPISQMETINTIQIPKAYEVLISLLVSHSISADIHPFDERLASLTLVLTYEDAGEYHHSKSFVIKPEATSWMRDTNAGISKFDCDFYLNITWQDV